jgi:uncharacterized protein (TIGR03437 family)
LGGAGVVVQDSTGAEHLARLLYAGPEQINYEIPEGVAAGEAKLTVLRGGIAVAQGTLQIAESAPALFAANSNGTGPAAAFALHVTPGGAQTLQPVAVFDAGAGEYVANPIGFGPEGDEVFLTLYGTGIRGGDEAEVTVGGAPAEITFSGKHESFVGLDQINVKVPRSMAGRGEVAVRVKVDGVAANLVRVSFE